MPVLQPNNPDVENEHPSRRLQIAMKELREGSFTIGWAIAALITTSGWLYFVARGVYFLFNRFLG
jgi:hypothetical protein